MKFCFFLIGILILAKNTFKIKTLKEKRINETREFFEQLVGEYPTCGRIWKTYIEQEVDIF